MNRLEERDQAYENLRSQFQNFQNLVMAFLPVDAHTGLQQQQSNPTLPQQQPTRVQPQIEQQEEPAKENHLDDYVDY